MSLTPSNRTLPWDWYQGRIPKNVLLAEETHLETTYSFLHYHSEEEVGLTLGNGSTVYLGTMFDVGPRGRVTIGKYALVHGAWIICDARIEIGDYALISWNVVLMDTYRGAITPEARRRELRRLPTSAHRRPEPIASARPIRIGRNVWIGFDCCVLPGVTIGESSVVGARSVVVEDVPPYTLVAGNPARHIRAIENDEIPETT